MIWFDLQDMGFSVPAIGSWGEQIRLPSWAGTSAPGVSPGLPFPWALVGGPSPLFLNPISCPPAFAYRECAQGLYRFLNRVRLPRVCLGLTWLGLSRRHMSCDNDDLSVFAPISSSSFNFF